MKNLLSKIRVIGVPIILCLALIFTSIESILSNSNLQGNARVINYTGIVRGATQRLVKMELNHHPNDELITKLDKILLGLSKGSDELNLIKLNDNHFQTLLGEMEEDWADIKNEIYRFREDDAYKEELFTMSEDYFELADQTVLAAEVYSENVVQDTRDFLFYMNAFFIGMAIIFAILAFYQEKRRQKLIEAEKKNREKSEQLSKRFEDMLVPMNEISELMYVSDIETYDLLFANEAGKKTFHIDNTKKNKCYRVIQGFDAPCPFCTNHLLSMDETYSWEYTNPLTKRHYLLKDRLMEWEGRLARMEIAFDITETANEKIELKKRLERDNILVDCIRELYRNHDLLAAMNYMLEHIGQMFGAQRAYVFLMEGDYASNVAEWCQEGIVPQIDNLQNVSLSEFALWIEMFKQQKDIVIENIESLKEKQRAEYEFLKKQDIQSVIMVSIEKGGLLAGSIGLDNPDPSLMSNAVTFLETLRYFVMLAIRRYEDEKMLQRLSYVDTLTSFYNRNRFIEDIEKIEKETNSIGVIYLDINGLKEVNDHFGHLSGDNLLKRCADIIQKSIEKGSFYRIGGDEFVVICQTIDEEEFLSYVNHLKEHFAQINDCKAAIGYKWSDSSQNIKKLINIADELMYQDKQSFYEQHDMTRRYRYNQKMLKNPKNNIDK
ncbi:sensor domain-containing diguanylate cyclase [Candidatus Stoquefichus sp. SB1]|uniref:sensor domain-containing diguanylate cyclase n=1 Tax=Candidatus Stoquefichus sp. SB1 TaxID=1658109 RepID=UPI0009E641EE|nr:diguanylate cyclase [Candidatus Stoquefichus sp. SB1]